jgi:hypothetical protein
MAMGEGYEIGDSALERGYSSVLAGTRAGVTA